MLRVLFPLGRVTGTSGWMCLVGISYPGSEPEDDSGLCLSLGCGRQSSPVILRWKGQTRLWLLAGRYPLRVVWSDPLGPGEKTQGVLMTASFGTKARSWGALPLLIQVQMDVQVK